MSDKVRLRVIRQPEYVQEFDAKTAETLVARGKWERVPDDKPAPTRKTGARPQHAPKPG